MRSEKAERLSRIVETQRDIAAAGLDPERVMALLVERSQALTGADGAMVSLLDGAELVTRAGAGIAAGTVGVRRPLGQSVAAHAIATGQPILIEDAESDPRIDQSMRRKVGDKSLICVPFFDGGRAVGALNVVSSSETDRLDEHDRETMEVLAVVLSSAVSQATAFELKRQQVEALARFEAMYHGAPIGIAMISPEGHVVESNAALLEILGYSAGELAERPFSVYTHPDDIGENAHVFREVMAGERDGYRMEKRYVRKDGAIVWANVSVSLVRDLAGNPSFAVGMVENVTERKLAEEALKRQAELNRHQALHDSLTGLPNRVLFRERIEQALQRAEREGEPARGRADGPRPLQGGQRRARPPRRRRAADRGRRGGCRRSCARRTPSRAWAATSSGCSCWGRAAPRASCRSSSASTARWRSRSSSSDLPLEIEASVGIAMYPDGRPGLRDAAAARRRGDVLGQGVEPALRVLRRGLAPPGPDAADAGGRAAARPGGARARAPLPAQGGPRGRDDHLGRGARALGAPGARAAPARRVHRLARATGLIRPLTLYVIDQALRQCRTGRPRASSSPWR